MKIINRLAIIFLVCNIFILLPAASQTTKRTLTNNQTKNIPSDISHQVRTFVRMGLYDPNEILKIVIEGLEPGRKINKANLKGLIEKQVKDWDNGKKVWPQVTDCDKIDSAFSAINKRNIIALQNAGYTQSDGYDDFREAYHNRSNKSQVLGYCFFHQQDIERALDGSGLYLSFGPGDSKKEKTNGSKVGRIICDELKRVGFKVEWDGSFNKRIFIPGFCWQKR